MMVIAKRHVIIVRVEAVRGKCPRGHQPGQEWEIKLKTPEGICLSAFDAIFPTIRALQSGGTFPWQKDPDEASVGCIDPINQVTFQIKRLEESCKA